MKSLQKIALGLLAPLVALIADVTAQEARDYPLGPIGGTYRVSANSSLAQVSTVTAGGPGAVAGLQTGDFIYGAFGKVFTPTGSYHYGVSQELGFAVDRAEGGDGVLPLMIVRPGSGGLSLDVNLSPVGALGVAYPLNSAKYNLIYETAVADLHARTMSANGNLAYLTGWTGLALLGQAANTSEVCCLMATTRWFAASWVLWPAPHRSRFPRG